MSDYIKREALLKDIEEERPVNWTDSESERQAESDFYKYRDIVMMQPTADVVEVKHGEWHLLYNCANEGVYCSVCNKKVYKTYYANQKIKSPFCPNCGAKMDLKEGAEE